MTGLEASLAMYKDKLNMKLKFGGEEGCIKADISGVTAQLIRRNSCEANNVEDQYKMLQRHFHPASLLI